MEKHALLIANSASMIDHFNKDNIRILQDMGYTISVAANFQEGNSSTVERIHAFASELAAQDIEICRFHGRSQNLGKRLSPSGF